MSFRNAYTYTAYYTRQNWYPNFRSRNKHMRVHICVFHRGADYFGLRKKSSRGNFRFQLQLTALAITWLASQRLARLGLSHNLRVTQRSYGDFADVANYRSQVVSRNLRKSRCRSHRSPR